MDQFAASVRPVCGQCAASVQPLCGETQSGLLMEHMFVVKTFGSEFYYKNISFNSIQTIDINIIAEKYQTNQKVEMQNHHNQ